MFRVLSARDGWTVKGTIRSARAKSFFSDSLAANLITGIELLDSDGLTRVLADTEPDVVVNCAGLTKHLPEGNIPTAVIAMNGLFPHRMATLCRLCGARMIHVSTDCVFSGNRGGYTEDCIPDATDLYGRSKIIGEVAGDNLLTLRTSTIGHELLSRHGLLEWFLAQTHCKGYTRAIFSGLPSVVFAQVVRDIVIPDRQLSGLYHVAGPAIPKADLLRIVAAVYRTNVEIIADDQFVVDRSLNAAHFREATGYCPPPWTEMINTMHGDYEKGSKQNV